jgi:hypothetical protein
MIEIAAAHGYVDPATSPPFAQADIVEIAARHLASNGPTTWQCDVHGTVQPCDGDVHHPNGARLCISLSPHCPHDTCAHGLTEDVGISDDEHEQLCWTSDDVEAWMNEHVAPEGYSFGWYSGEFFLWSTMQWCEHDGGFPCADCGATSEDEVLS